MKKVLLLKGTRPDDTSTAQRLYDALQDVYDDIAWSICSYDDLMFDIKTGSVRVFSTTLNVDVASFDLVYLRDFQGFEHERNACAYYLQLHNVRFLNSDTANFQHLTKLTQMMALAAANLTVPHTLYASDPLKVAPAVAGLGERVIVKSITGANGTDNYLVPRGSFEETVEARGLQKCVVQEYIPNTFDVRVIVLGDTIGTVCKRIRQRAGDHRNNVAQGSRKEFQPVSYLSEQAQQACIAAARLFKREVAGCDIIYDEATGAYVFLEVNINFGMDGKDVKPPEALAFGAYIRALLSKE